MDALLYVGANKETVAEASKAIMDILNTQNAEKVKIVAIKSLTGICEVKHTTISGCTLTNNAALKED